MNDVDVISMLTYNFDTIKHEFKLNRVFEYQYNLKNFEGNIFIVSNNILCY